ncbi:MAG: nuclear transport factor 2 family protein [Candidatus Latescibacteria bacterium]|nr:nuclear transport factor 2 family protein [Candidatus Latescibacterota bacterium]
MSPTAKVLNHHLEAFGSGDVEGIVSDYSEDSVILTQGGALKGLDAIRGAFTGMVAEFSKPGMTFEMLQMNIEGEVAFIIWKAETADNIYELGTDTFVIRDGVIVSQTLCVVAKPKEAMAE